jgi:hypothetical protein
MFFAVHPVHTEAVTSTVGRAELLSLLFVLASLVWYKKRRWMLALISVHIAYACKESGLLGLPLMVWLDITIPRESAGQVEEKSSTYLRWSGLVAVFTTNIFARVILLDRQTSPSFSFVDNPLWFHERFTDQLFATVRVHLEYLRLLVLPARLSCDYSMQCIVECQVLVCQLLAAFMYFGVGGLCLGSAISFARGSSTFATIPTFAIGFAAIASAPALHIIKVGLLVAERLLYAPSAGH